MAKKIVIVEDDQLLSDLYKETFAAQYPWLIEVVTDGRQAVDRILQIMPDLVILDILMPAISGIDILKALKANPVTNGTIVAVASNLDESDTKREVMKLGAAAYFVKSQTQAAEMAKKCAALLDNAT